MLVDTNFTNIAEARMAGLPADCSSILSEHVRDELDLSGIGRLLAMTFNDEVNTMAVREFTHQFGRANVYQLASPSQSSGKRVLIAEHLRGRKLFGDQWHHDELALRLASGSVVKKTQLTESFTYDDFLQRYGPTAILLFVIDEDKRLLVRTAGEKNRASRRTDGDCDCGRTTCVIRPGGGHFINVVRGWGDSAEVAYGAVFALVSRASATFLAPSTEERSHATTVDCSMPCGRTRALEQPSNAIARNDSCKVIGNPLRPLSQHGRLIS